MGTELAQRPASSYPVPSLAWKQDPETGFLYIDDTVKGSMDPFCVEKKKEFIVQYHVRYPDLNETLKQVGCSRRTFYWHLKFDSCFREAVNDIKEEKMDKLESVMYQVAIQPKSSSFMDRIAMLRAHRSDIYTEKRIVLGAKDLDPSLLAHKQEHLGTIVDAELVQGPGTQALSSQSVSSGPGSEAPEPGTQAQLPPAEAPGPKA